MTAPRPQNFALMTLALVLATLFCMFAPRPAKAAGTAEFCYREPGRNIGTLPNLGSVLNDFGSCVIDVLEIGDQDGDLVADEVIYNEDKQALGNTGGLTRCTTFDAVTTAAIVGTGCTPLPRLYRVQCDDDSSNAGPVAYMVHTLNQSALSPAVHAPNLPLETQLALGGSPESAHFREASKKAPSMRDLGTTDPLSQCVVSAIDNTTTPGTEIVVEALTVAAPGPGGGQLQTEDFTVSLAAVDIFRFQCETTGGVKSTWIEATGAEGVNTPQAPREFEVFDD